MEGASITTLHRKRGNLTSQITKIFKGGEQKHIRCPRTEGSPRADFKSTGETGLSLAEPLQNC